MRYKLGLVVGKFAPLHHGHEWLVKQAAVQCEHLLILSYSKPEYDRCDVARRGQWLSTRLPEHECLVIDDALLVHLCRLRGIVARVMPLNTAEDAIHQAWLAWLVGEVLERKPDAIFCSEDYGPACAQTLSLALGQEVAAVVVDRNRAHFPISASAIRRSPEIASLWAAPVVAASFVRRVVLLGGESSGKTTLAAALAERLDTCWVPEYGRELWELQGGLCEPDLLKIAREQVRREDAASEKARSWLVCDTSPLTTCGYAGWMFGRVEPELSILAQRRYDATILCKPDFAFVQDGTRRDDSFRSRQHAWYIEQLRAIGTPWLAVGGSIEERVRAVTAWLEQGQACLK